MRSIKQARLDFAHHPARPSLRFFFAGLDPAVVTATVALVAYGLVVVYSASLSIAAASPARQALGAGLGFVVALAMYRFDMRKLANCTLALLVIDCALMLAPLLPFFAYSANGLTGWVKIPVIGFTFQTSELAKPVTVLLMASLCARYGGRVTSLSDYMRLCAVLAVPFLLILLQPDLGTGLVILVSGAVVIVTVILLVLGVAAVLLTDGIIDNLVGDEHSLFKDYQMNRLLVFLDPDSDTTNAGYNLRQSMIAVGSGGLFGKGFGNATQAASGFLPEAHTDFAFALLSEQFGFVGAAVLIALYMVLVFSAIRIAMRSESLFAKLTLLGIAAMWTFQIFENIGMCLSLMPITGIPLPFISFGSSSMIVQLLTVGIVLSAGAHDGRESLCAHF